MIEIFQDAAGEWRFNIKARNGQVVASSEGYTLRKDAVRAVMAIVRVIRDPDLRILRLDENHRAVTVDLSGSGNG